MDQVADEGFEVAFDRLYPRACRLARRIVGDRVLAEDIAAEAMARPYARWARVSALPWLDGWVLRVTSNLAIDHTRRRFPAPTSAPAPDEEAVALRLALAECLRTLPRRQRQAIALHYLTGLREAEVAQALGISAGSVKTHVHRGLVALRARLGPDAEEVAPLALDR